MAMNGTHTEDLPPSKRRRYFLDADGQEATAEFKEEVPQKNEESYPESLGAILGDSLSTDQLSLLNKAAKGDAERAINMFLDGSWKPPVIEQSAPSFAKVVHAPGNLVKEDAGTKKLALIPDRRYIGVFGAEGWATRGGAGLISYGEELTIERQKIQPLASTRKGKSKKGSASQTVAAPAFGRRKSQDIVVRFRNSRNEEVGRLSQDTAMFVSTLMDQEICHFEGQCVYAPETLKTNDTIFIQIRCFLLKKALTPITQEFKSDTGRKMDLFHSQETEEERDLRLRQLSLAKLFDQINLEPINSANEKARKEIIKANESAESSPALALAADFQSTNTSGDEEAEDGKELEQDQLDALYRKAQSFDFNSPEAEPADTFALNLRSYQKQALHWLLKKERNERADQESMHPLWEEYAWPMKDENDQDLPDYNVAKFYLNPYSGQMSLEFPRQEQNCLGGILADEMGLGKTIEMLSLIHSNRPKIEPQTRASALNLLRSKPAEVEDAPNTTLVVAPMSLLAQWESETEVASKPGTMKPLVYYATSRENLHAQCTGDNVATAPNVVITSYGTLLSEYTHLASSKQDRAAHGGLFSVRFFRIILDEAHSIKNRSSKTAKACYELEAVHRWALTGTPIVNRLEDLFSLVRFLRVEPWSNFSFWRTFITVPFESRDFIRALDVVQTVLEPLVLRRTKEMKLPDGTPLVPLPKKDIIVQEIELSEREREVYDHIFSRVRQTFNTNVEAGTLLKSYTTIFAQILRLRQSCCHPVLVRKKEIVADEAEAQALEDAASGLADDMDLNVLIDQFSATEAESETNVYNANILQQIQDEATNECPICTSEPMENLSVTGCFHATCKACLLEHISYQKKHGNTPKCVVCRKVINEREIFEVIRDDPLPGQPESTPTIKLRRIHGGSSAKIDALIERLKGFRKLGDFSKSVVFSQFTSFLDIIEPALKREGIPYVRFDGSMSQPARAAVVAKFKAVPSDGMVLLISLKAGGVGLNLTEARRVFMMDPWWSFAVEAQAIDRVHRMGQESAVEIYRFIVKDSVEERMIHKIQARKKFIASSLGMMDQEEKRQQRIEDIKDLLS